MVTYSKDAMQCANDVSVNNRMGASIYLIVE